MGETELAASLRAWLSDRADYVREQEMVTLFYKWENEGVRVSYDFSKFIFRNVKTIKEVYWLIGGPIIGKSAL